MNKEHMINALNKATEINIPRLATIVTTWVCTLDSLKWMRQACIYVDKLVNPCNAIQPFSSAKINILFHENIVFKYFMTGSKQRASHIFYWKETTLGKSLGLLFLFVRVYFVSYSYFWKFLKHISSLPWHVWEISKNKSNSIGIFSNFQWNAILLNEISF